MIVSGSICTVSYASQWSQTSTPSQFLYKEHGDLAATMRNNTEPIGHNIHCDGRFVAKSGLNGLLISIIGII